MRILVIRFSSLGDIVLTTAFLSWIKGQFPKIKIDFLTLKDNSLLVEELPFINQVFAHDKASGLPDILRLKSLTRDLKKNNYDFVIDLHGTTRSFFIKLFLNNIPHLSIDKWRLERWLLVKFKKDFIHQNPLHYLRPMYDFEDILCREFELEEFKNYQIEKSLASYTSSPASLIKTEPKRILLIAPGASFQTKKYPVSYFSEIATEVLTQDNELEVHIIGAPSENECDELFQKLQAFSKRVKNLKGTLSFKEALEYVAQTKVVLSNDSLFAHIADSCGVAALVIFGPTDERFGFAPYGEKSKSYSVKNLACRPCSTTGSKDCTRTNQFCMDNINKEEIISDILERL
jgi:heptosyltransferase-2